ncbi:unnamed protein product [Paramecium sonneborni]|uniref:WD40 repeat-containing protein n=1 Tax=Paramecium sonneborni TaxID=65129 RepID=A0A8S1L1P8_9CILI|nr:unnamed protein product [Paramecium sonneborni]
MLKFRLPEVIESNCRRREDSKTIIGSHNGKQRQIVIIFRESATQVNLNSNIIINHSTISLINTKTIFLSINIEQFNQIRQQMLSIAINKDCSILIAGCKKEIKVFEWKQEVLKQTQLLSEHQGDVFTLNFMKKSNHFISGSEDQSIIIWSVNQSNKWICQQRLNQHNGWIYCLVLNNNEDLIISGSRDCAIKFWTKQNQWLCEQTITDHTNYVLGLSLNQQQNKLISCGYDALILIIVQSQQDSKWIVIQKINIETFVSRICFINDNVFIFQPDEIEQMYVYEINNTNKQYLKTQDIFVKGGSSDSLLFSLQFIKSKCLLVNRNDKYVNLIRAKENGEYQIEQVIEFGHINLFGCMSDDGEYLITWDQGSKEIQIRNYNEI